MVFSQSEGPNTSSITSSDGTGIVSWTNLSNSTLSDDSYVECLNLDNNKKSDYLLLTGFGFSIPAGSTIDGIEVFIERHSDGDIKKEDVKLILNGVLNSTNQGNGNWPTTDGTLTYGNPTDAWKNPAPTTLDVNSSNFGVAIRITSNINNNNLYIDSVSMKIHYAFPPLPIELLYFNGSVKNNVVYLNWATSSESNNDYFTIEKCRYLSGNNVKFKEVSKIQGAGNSNNLLQYFHVDDNPYHGLNYYRLKQTDFDGSYSYSELLVINCIKSIRDELDIRPYPNPATQDDDIYVKVMGEEDSEVLVVVVDLLGNTRYSKVIILDDTIFTIAIDPYHRLDSGVYLIVASSNDKLVNKKLVIK